MRLCVLPLQESSPGDRLGRRPRSSPLCDTRSGNINRLLPCCQSADRTLLHVNSYQSPETGRGEEVREEEEEEERERDKCLVAMIIFISFSTEVEL